VGADDSVNDLAQGTKGLLSVFHGAVSGRHIVYVSATEPDGTEVAATQEIRIDNAGPYGRITGDMGAVSRMLGRALSVRDGGYLSLTAVDDTGNASHRTWVWQAFAGFLSPLDGYQAWDVLQHHLTAHNGIWLSEDTKYEDAWNAR
jgi:hypothetical protein